MSGPGPVVLASTHRNREMQQYEGETINAVGEVEAHPTGESVLCLDFNKELLVSGSNKGSVMVSKYSLIMELCFSMTSAPQPAHSQTYCQVRLFDNKITVLQKKQEEIKQKAY